MTQAWLKNSINKAPTDPGVYVFKNSQKKLLYVGKAANLKNRIRQYLRTSDHRILQMLAKATSIKTIKTNSEIEALILESQYVKKYKPAFNIMLRDDKNFFYVIFSNDKFPRVFVTHQLTHLGPFTDGTALKTTLRYLRKVFPYCTCKKPHNNFCLNYHIERCPGFCCLKQQNPDQQLTTYPTGSLSADRHSEKGRTSSGAGNKQQYRKNIKALKDILSGKKTSLLKGLEKEMIERGKEAAQSDYRSERASLKGQERFQEAIELRNKIEKIKRVFENARIIQNIPYYDISNNHGISALLELKKFLKLKKLPHRIESYDIANIQGKHAVGAMAVFTNGEPNKSEYRKFRIRNLQNTNHKSQITNKLKTQNSKFKTGGDTGMLKEILTRRFRHPEWPMPDLILVDGGKAQLNAVRSIINNLQLTIDKKLAVIALTKNPKHKGVKLFIQNKKEAVPLSKLPISVKNLLLSVDSEAHHFATSYYRKLHRKKLTPRFTP